MKKRNIKELVASAVLTIGLISPLAVTSQSNNLLLGTTTTVQAATRKIKLTHNAYIYNYRGRRVGRRVLHKYTTHTYFSVRKIHGKRYYRIGHNRYVKAGNARTISSDSKRTITPTSINTSSLGSPIFKIHMLYDDTNDVYKNSSDSSWFGNKYFKEGDYNVYAYKNGKYEIGQNLWVLNTAGEKINGSNNSNNVPSTPVEKDSKPNENTKSSSNNYIVSANKEHQIAVEFVKDVNEWREKQGLKPFTLVTSGWLAEGTEVRANDNLEMVKTTGMFSHTRPNGQEWYTAFNDPSYSLKGECITSILTESQPKDSAKDAFIRFVYKDADSNWGHREILGENLDNPKISIALANDKSGSPVMIVNTADFN